jgi:hypothetical protein
MPSPSSVQRPGPHLLAAAALPLLLAGLACADKTPARIEVSPLPALILNRSPLPVKATPVNKDGKPVSGPSLTYAVAPGDLLEASLSGSIRCLKTGDGKLVVTGGGISSEVPVKCRIPTLIELPESLRLTLGAKPSALHARALTEGGTPMPDVPVVISSSAPNVVRVEGDRVIPVAVGRASLKASVDGIVAVAPVEVVESIASGTLTLADGQKRSWTLRPGLYSVSIDVAPPRDVAQGVTLVWQGARCDDRPEGRTHQLTCDAPDGATLTVANPVTYGLGLAVSGKVEIDRVPAP